jgi:hypothetical protein
MPRAARRADDLWLGYGQADTRRVSEARWSTESGPRGRGSRRRGLDVILLALALLGGAVAAGFAVHANRMQPDVDGAVISRGPAWSDDGSDDGVGGTLDFSDGCIRVGTTLVVWPSGAKWDADDRAVVTNEGTRFHDGDSFASGVGYLPGSQAELLAEDAVARVIRDCSVTDVLVLVEEVFARAP